MDVSTVTYFTIFLNDKAGQLATISATLLENEVSLHGIWGFGTSLGNAQVQVIPVDPSQFKNVARNKQWSIKEGTCFYLHGQDKTGALVDVLNKIAEHDIFIVALDALAVDGQFGCYLWGSDEDHVELSQVLGLKSALM
ncbi:MAG: hypothetical protein KDD70_14930 [Bdellovibrionales bacterium]|nr:hypothetical protein [Bdellovibrionales bacterium]